jgi:hypothetical protein
MNRSGAGTGATAREPGSTKTGSLRALAAPDLLAIARSLRMEIEARVEGGVWVLYDVLGIAAKEDLEELRGRLAMVQGELLARRDAWT